jgi:hypothetical protein
MTHTFRVLLAAAAIAGAAVPTGGFAQTAAPAAPNQAMMHGMQGQTQGQGMQGHGPQGQGMQGMGGSSPQTGAPAQMGPGMGMGPGMMMGQGMQGGMPMMQMMMQGQMGGTPSEHIEGRIAFLHAELKITAAQMPAWTEFADVLRANAKRLSDIRAAVAQRTTASAVDRLDDQERWLSARLEGVRALKPAYAKLHAVLDDKQKAMAEELVKAHARGH